ncbi:MAG: adenylosuccinate synthetase [Candidatus Falkowbacteria bacterium]|nr:adenylosuccinate synthetase [Candidatus Falkowbacteria bacterium]
MEKLLKNVNVLAITCLQWGDTGKGKLVDLFALWADIIARGTGGDNAGHTICYNGNTYVFHIVPSGILYDKDGKINIIGNGTVVYAKTLCNELGLLTANGLSYQNLMLAWNAKLILPSHILLDRVRESGKDGRIGSTGKGIAPTYMDHVGRKGLIVNDLLNPDIFAAKLKRHLVEKRLLLKNYDHGLIQEIMAHEHLEHGAYYNAKKIFDEESIIQKYLAYGQKLRPLIKDTDNFLRNAHKGGAKILLEGAQGNLLSIDHGTYPYVTSSDCSVAGLAKGVGLSARDVDKSLGIIKGFYETRVGEGPFPTEMGGKESDLWCNGGQATKEIEAAKYAKVPINWQSAFDQGVGIRIRGGEYGATTGRPRRTGWLDLPLLSYSIKFSGPEVVLTKLDVLDECEVIKICSAYRYEGPTFQHADRTIKAGDVLKDVIPNDEFLKHCVPIYREFPGWQCSIEKTRNFTDLPSKLKDILQFIVEETGIDPKIISVGADREATIFV